MSKKQKKHRSGAKEESSKMPKMEEVAEAVAKREEASEVIEAEELEKEEPGLPLPMAPVVRLVKAQVGEKMISSKVKIAMNTFLGEVAAAVAKEMGQTRYPMVEMDDFLRATKPYTYAKELQAEKERVVKELEIMRSQIDSLIKEFQRKFAIPKADEFSVLPEASER